MYTVAIIEDTNENYKDVIKNFTLFYDGKVAIANIPCIKHIERFVPQNNRIKRGESLFKYYVSIIENTDADIYIVDWDLKFPDDESKTPKDIFNALPKNFNYRTKYWIFYSQPDSNSALEFINTFFPAKSNISTPGKSSIVNTPKEKEVNLFTKSINIAIAYVESCKTVSWAPEKENSDVWIEFKGPFYDLEKPDPMERSFRLKKFWFHKDFIVCAAYDKPYAVIISLYGGRIKIVYVRFDRMQEFKEKLSLNGDRSFYYNAKYFDDEEQLKGEYKIDIGEKAAILQSEYLYHNKKTKVKSTRNINKQIELFKQHGII